ncbi:small acid-soluble spore protein L [Bacillus subtilis]
MKKKDKGRLTGGVTPQGDLEGNTHNDPKTELEERAKKSNTKNAREDLNDLSSVQLFKHTLNSFDLVAAKHVSRLLHLQSK